MRGQKHGNIYSSQRPKLCCWNNRQQSKQKWSTIVKQTRLSDHKLRMYHRQFQFASPYEPVHDSRRGTLASVLLVSGASAALAFASASTWPGPGGGCFGAQLKRSKLEVHRLRTTEFGQYLDHLEESFNSKTVTPS